MKIYFLSSQPCALSINDCYFGITDAFERFAHLSLKEKTCVRFQPENAQSICFFLTEDIRFSPPQGCDVYLLRDGIAIYAYDFAPNDYTLRPITQLREGKTLATLFMQGRVHLSIENENGFFTSTLPPSFATATLTLRGDFLFVETPSQLAVYTKTGECVLLEDILSVTIAEDTLTLRLPLSDRFSRTATCRYRMQENAFKRISFQIEQPATAPKEDLLAYAFFESIRIGGDYTQLLCESLREKADQIVAFLGDFCDVVITDDVRVCGLVRKKQPHLFEVDYFHVEIEEGKITDVKG